MEKLLSVIIPCYNVENLIDRCFDSIKEQTIGIDNIEVIMIDDCSTDNTWGKLQSYEEQYPSSVMIIHCDENGRQGTARNLGVRYSSAKYVTFVDADDFIDVRMLEELYAQMLTDDYDLVMCGHVRDLGRSDEYPMENGSGPKRYLLDTKEKQGTFLMCMCLGSLCMAKLYNKQFLLENDIYFLEKCAYEDHFFMALLHLYVRKVLIIDRNYYHYVVNENSTVLTKNATHHYDVLAVDEMTWTECGRRGFLGDFRLQLEVYFLLLGFISPLIGNVKRFDDPPYDFYLKLKEETLKRIPDYEKNPYIKDYATELNYILLETLKLPLGEKEFKNLCEIIKKVH